MVIKVNSIQKTTSSQSSAALIMLNDTTIMLLKNNHGGNNMKINKVLSLSIFLMLSCGSTDNGSLSKENMAIFDRCTLFFRGIDDCGYGLYALMVADDSKQGWIFLNAWYKGITDFRLLAMDSAEVDTIRVLGVLSAATRYDIREIHPTREHSLGVYLKGKEKPIIISLD